MQVRTRWPLVLVLPWVPHGLHGVVPELLGENGPHVEGFLRGGGGVNVAGAAGRHYAPGDPITEKKKKKKKNRDQIVKLKKRQM